MDDQEFDPHNEAIRSSAMLVSLHTSGWSARIQDLDAAKAAARAKGVSESSVSASTNLMDGADTRLKATNNSLEACRRAHASLTLPWNTEFGKRGPRMLPNAMWLEYMKTVGQARSEFHRIRDDFVANYLADVAIAQPRVKMVGDPLGLYPPASEIAKRFSISIDQQPIPAGAHFKGLPEQYAKEIKQSVEDRIKARMDGAMTEAYQRTHAAVKNLWEGLSRPGVPTFKSAAIENVRELEAMLKAWNIAGDAQVDDLADQVGKLVDGEDMRSLKDNETVRGLVAGEAKRIVELIESWEVLP